MTPVDAVARSAARAFGVHVTAGAIKAGGSGRTLLIIQLLGLAAAILLLDQARRHLLFDFNAAAMGEYTTGIFGDATTGGRVHCTELATAPCAAAWIEAGKPPAIVWFGNSQLHGVNRYKPGDKTAIMAAHDALAGQGVWLTGYSLPNISMMEIAAATYRYGLDYNPKVVVFPVVFNGLRSGSVRDEVLPLLKRPGAARIRGTRIAKFLAPLMAERTVVAAPKTLADRSEDALEAGLVARAPLWAARADLRALYDYAFDMTRHRVFGVTAQTPRSLINPGYRSQMALLAALAADLHDRGVKVVLYVPPYRTDVPGPYIPAEYRQFRTELQALCKAQQAQCADYSDLVPGPEWGLVKDHLSGTIDYDFMHFTAKGHAALANAIAAQVQP